jgi:oxalate decarboxylase/phosphoglucose isomerase-like protein (cupin superfamily)
MGLEFVKTYGHYHPRVNPKLRYTYPEIYEVLDGDAHYLLQRALNDESVDDVTLVKATRGDKVIVPPNYGHVTINPSERTLKMANWVPAVRVDLRASHQLRGPSYTSLTTADCCTTERLITCPAWQLNALVSSHSVHRCTRGTRCETLGAHGF